MTLGLTDRRPPRLLLGRDATLAELANRAGSLGVTVVTGRPQIGKSRLLEALDERLTGGGFLVGRWESSGQEPDLMLRRGLDGLQPLAGGIVVARAGGDSRAALQRRGAHTRFESHLTARRQRVRHHSRRRASLDFRDRRRRAALSDSFTQASRLRPMPGAHCDARRRQWPANRADPGRLRPVARRACSQPEDRIRLIHLIREWVPVGLENLLHPQRGARWLVVFAFGLIHGFGFAEALSELGLGSSAPEVALSLLAFNAGVEVGQLAVAAAMPIVWAMRSRPAWNARLGPACSVMIVMAGGYWLIERLP